MKTIEQRFDDGEGPIDAFLKDGLIDTMTEFVANNPLMVCLTPGEYDEEGNPLSDDVLPAKTRALAERQQEELPSHPSNIRAFTADEEMPCRRCSRVIRAGDVFTGSEETRWTAHLACVVCRICGRMLMQGDAIFSTESGVAMCYHILPDDLPDDVAVGADDAAVENSK
ncbi:LIM domain-containing protein [Streptomyces sp. B1-3]|uniref:LIM domain-containing protein n=1 Tax=Streptomyces sp. B1-3 TaxID=3141453 RepID=UPI003D29A545